MKEEKKGKKAEKADVLDRPVRAAIREDDLASYAFVSGGVCERPIRGIVVSFMGLGCMAMYKEGDDAIDRRLGEKGILYVVPYTDPWGWMNRRQAEYTDLVLDAVYRKYDLAPSVPVAYAGGSMGGMCALTYAVRASRRPIAVAVNCPVCDAVLHFGERPDLPRTMVSALWDEGGTLREALESISPLHLVDRMPDIPYYFWHGTADDMVNFDAHSARLVAAMKARGRSVEFRVIPDRGHCALPPEEGEVYVSRLIGAFDGIGK